ncbi:protein FAM216A-like [Megalops cyprinoides]|uniref:protein FAM216A-like n=1 Tax=Megalops cyprinoides TaxID=118141 RepID=UPI0018645B6A|nr:protein FAM216A-like [Megalops cyprinoides]
MRKQVTFVEEENSNGDHLNRHDSSRYLATRSAGPYEPHRGKYLGSQSLFNGQDASTKTRRTSHFKAAPQQLSETQQMKTIHIPKSMMAAPFLQHPGLTHGQKRYLYSIANVYSTDHMRKLMKRHYLNVLNQCIRAGQNGLAENRTQQLKKKQAFEWGSKTDSRSQEKAKPNGDRHTAARNSGKIILPSIANSQSRTTSTTSYERT